MLKIDQMLRPSIAMATYNGASYLREQLDSIAGQTISPFELIILDDRSCDATVQIIENFAAGVDFPVRWSVNERRLGYRQNFVECASLCKGDVIFFCDQDDVWHPEKLSIMLKYFDRHDVFLAYHNATVCDENRRPRFPLYDDGSQNFLLSLKNPDPLHFALGFTQAFRRELLIFNDLFSMSRDHVKKKDVPDYENLAHDQWYIFISLILNGVAYCPKILAEYRQHDGNETGIKENKKKSRFQSGIERALFGPGWDNLAYAQEAAARGDVAEIVSLRSKQYGWKNVRDLAALYHSLSDRLTARECNYYGANIIVRMSALLNNIRSGSYSSVDKFHFKLSWIIVDTLRALTGVSDSSHFSPSARTRSTKNG